MALLRFGFMGGGASVLTEIWQMHSEWAMALLSLAVLVAFAAPDGLPGLAGVRAGDQPLIGVP